VTEVTMTRLVALLLVGLTACSPVNGDRYSRKQAEKSLAKLEEPGIVVGEFRLRKVVDGDTVWVEGLDASLRLLGIDAEETFKNDADRRAVEADWPGYLAKKRGNSKRPVKLATPLGEVATEWAKQWFAGIDKVRIERDHPAEVRDRFNRFLTYVLAEKDGVWKVFNVELVRAGMSPYFPKYGFSRRYHQEFLEAQAEAKAAKRGIWDPNLLHAPDYDEREEWWMARGKFVDEFRREGEGKPNYVDLTHWDSMKQIEAHLGKEVHILSTVDDLVLNTKGPARVTLSHRSRGGFPLIFWDRDLLGTTGLRQWKGEYVVVTGVPSVYTFKGSGRRQLQIQVDSASQIKLSPIPGLSPPTVAGP
jgi:endonuclease YncB( thermonuclease family)